MSKEKPKEKTSDPYEIYRRLIKAAQVEKAKKTEEKPK